MSDFTAREVFLDNKFCLIVLQGSKIRQRQYQFILGGSKIWGAVQLDMTAPRFGELRIGWSKSESTGVDVVFFVGSVLVVELVWGCTSSAVRSSQKRSSGCHLSNTARRGLCRYTSSKKKSPTTPSKAQERELENYKRPLRENFFIFLFFYFLYFWRSFTQYKVSTAAHH